jgi:predicted transcriptional regulator
MIFSHCANTLRSKAATCNKLIIMEKLPAVKFIFHRLNKLKKVEQHHLQRLKPALRKEVIRYIHSEFFNLKDEAQDAFYEKFCILLNRVAIAEYNHAIIIACIEDILKKTGLIPPVANIAEITGLSRKTVSKYLKNFKLSETWKERNDALNIMSQNVVSLMLQRALNGDLRASKIYLDYINKSLAAETSGQRNNYIQINNTIINQQLIQQLNPEQLKLIEKIISESNKGGVKDDNEEMKALGE